MKTCPRCGSALFRVLYPSDSYLNRDQWESIRAGDYYCMTCPPVKTGLKFLYYFERELVVIEPHHNLD